jgi:hypothetical protein
MTTTAATAEGLLIDLEHRHDQVQDHGRPDGHPEGDAHHRGAGHTYVDRHVSQRFLHATLISLFAGVQLVWIGALAYGVWELHF